MSLVISTRLNKTQFGISRSRRHELTRLLAFTTPQQRQIALLRLHKTQIRSLHSSVRKQELTHAQVDAILFRLEQIAAARCGVGDCFDNGGRGRATAARRHRWPDDRAPAPLAVVAATPTPRWLPPLRDQLMRSNQSVQCATKRRSRLARPTWMRCYRISAISSRASPAWQ